MQRKITLSGAICGPIWQPGYVCSKPIHVKLERTNPLDVSNVRRSLYDMIADVLNDGDFLSARLTADTTIWIVDCEYKKVHGQTIGRERSRSIDVTMLPSIADLVDSDMYTSDFD